MNWVLWVLLSPVTFLFVIFILHTLRENVFNRHIIRYSRFNRPNTLSKHDVKLTYKQWCNFLVIKPEAFCVKDGCLYEVNSNSGGWEKYTKIHFNFRDYLRFVFAYNRLQRKKTKSAANKKERDDLAAFLTRMQENINDYRKKVDSECESAKSQLSNVAENMLKQNKEYISHNEKRLYYRGIYPSTPFVRNVGDIYMSKDGEKMYVIDKELCTQRWATDKLLAYISKEGMDGEEVFDFVTSAVGEEAVKYTYRGEGLTKMIPDMKPGDIYYNPVLKKYMVMEETGTMTYLTTGDFVDRFGGIEKYEKI